MAAIERNGRARIALSGGRTPWRAFELLDRHPKVDWSRVELLQVDERIVPDDDPDRNLAHLRASLSGAARAALRPMPVTEPDHEAAAAAYAAALPERFDLVHLGLGPDGHTASLVPGDPVLKVDDDLVACTGTYQGRRRMTLTYPALERAERVLWLITGAEKREALVRLLAADPLIPAGRLATLPGVVVVDEAAQPG